MSALHCKSRFLFISLSLAVLMGTLGGCERASPPASIPAEQVQVDLAADPALTAISEQAWQQGSQLLAASNEQTDLLNQAIAAFLAAPNPSSLESARAAWRRAHTSWQGFGPLLMMGVSNPGLFQGLQDWQFMIDAWPIQPGFLDYFAEYQQSGIVNDIALPVSAEELRTQHGLTDLSDVAIGFHAIEYLLWGEATTINSGARPYTDYQAATELSALQLQAGLRLIDLPPNRRRDLLRLLGQLLADDIQALKAQWDNPQGALRLSYAQLQSQSQAQLLASATAVWLDTQLVELALAKNAPAAIDDSPDQDFPDILDKHNAFSGFATADLALGLATIESLFLKPDTSLGPWLLKAADQTAFATRLAEQRVLLLADSAQPGNKVNTKANDKGYEKLVKLLLELQTALTASGSDSALEGIETGGSGDL